MTDGEGVTLPSELKLGSFADARIKEILALQSYISEPRQGQAAAQQLPRHLRRRAVSHNPKRLPKRLRDRHCKEREKSGCNQKPNKRPSRKYRRRPNNLLQEYNRRQKEFVWTETHIWHAKRFHMTSCWGYKLAEYPNEKSFRSCYRATAKQCLMSDISYFPVIEICGQEREIIEKLSNFTPPEISTGFDQGQCLSGEREGKTSLYEVNQFPFGVLGEVSYLWNPDKNDRRQLWIWCHPAFYESIKNALFKEFSATEIVEQIENCPEIDRTDRVNSQKLATKNVPFSRVPKFKSQNCQSVTLSLLKDTINRFRLVGPLSGQTLGRTLKVANINNPNYEVQVKLWSKLQTLEPKNVRSGTILSLTVRDPRLILPRKKGEMDEEDDACFSDDLNVGDETLVSSAIWDSSWRDEISLKKLSDHQINQKRAELLIPGSQVPEESNESKPSVLLIQQSRSSNGFGSGWDLILPAGWGMPFWMNLIYQGAKVGGLRELRNLNFEIGEFDDLKRFSDCEVGQNYSRQEQKLLTDEYFSHPPDKRCNFNKIKMVTPFYSPLDVLLADFTQNSEDNKFFIIRERKLLLKWIEVLNSGNIVEIPDLEKHGYLSVSVEVIGKGTVCANSIICIPNPEDLKNPSQVIRESKREDENSLRRKEFSKKHQQRKGALRRKWKTAKDHLVQMKAEGLLKKQKLDPDLEREQNAKIDSLKQERITENHSFNLESRKLWLPECQSVKNSSSRTVIGFVLSGGYSLRVGKIRGLGYVPTLGILEYLVKSDTSYPRKVLVREPSSIDYRWANLSIIID